MVAGPAAGFAGGVWEWEGPPGGLLGRRADPALTIDAGCSARQAARPARRSSGSSGAGLSRAGRAPTECAVGCRVPAGLSD